MGESGTPDRFPWWDKCDISPGADAIAPCAPGRGSQGRPQAARVAGRLDCREIGRAMIRAGSGKVACD
jgi:hypothetical protein